MFMQVLAFKFIEKQTQLIRLFQPTTQICLYEMFILILPASLEVHIVQAQTIS